MRKLLEESKQLDENITHEGAISFDGMTLVVGSKEATVVIAIGEGDLRYVLDGGSIKVAYTIGGRSY